MTKIDKTMENENEEIIDSTIDTDTTDNENDFEESHDNSAEISDLQKKIKTLEAQKEHWRTKATTDKKEVKETENINFSVKDQIAIVSANVHEDDIDEIAEYASFKKISISEALKSDVIKTILSNKAEFRKTAETSNTSSARKGATKATDESLMSGLSKGSVPETRDEAERLFWARRGGKR